MLSQTIRFLLFLWTRRSNSFRFFLPSKFNLTYIKRLTPSPFVAEGNQFKVIELCVCVSECAGLKSFRLVFSPAPSLLCEVCAKAEAGVSREASCVCVALAADTTVCFPVVRWLDSREDYIILELCPLIQCCLPSSFFLPLFVLSFTLDQKRHLITK